MNTIAADRPSSEQPDTASCVSTAFDDLLADYEQLQAAWVERNGGPEPGIASTCDHLREAKAFAAALMRGDDTPVLGDGQAARRVAVRLTWALGLLREFWRTGSAPQVVG